MCGITTSRPNRCWWDLDLGNGPQTALVQATKTGMVYVLNRLTGEPLIPIEERPVPGSGVPGEKLSPTQPFSTLPPLVNQQPYSEDDAFGIAWFDESGCRRTISRVSI